MGVAGAQFDPASSTKGLFINIYEMDLFLHGTYEIGSISISGQVLIGCVLTLKFAEIGLKHCSLHWSLRNMLANMIHLGCLASIHTQPRPVDEH